MAIFRITLLTATGRIGLIIILAFFGVELLFLFILKTLQLGSAHIDQSNRKPPPSTGFHHSVQPLVLNITLILSHILNLTLTPCLPFNPQLYFVTETCSGPWESAVGGCFLI